MTIDVAELKNNIFKYLKISQTEDILITQNGKVLTKLSNPYKEDVAKMEDIFGTLPENASLEEVNDERAAKL